jgi:hypothetical protein
VWWHAREVAEYVKKTRVPLPPATDHDAEADRPPGTAGEREPARRRAVAERPDRDRRCAARADRGDARLEGRDVARSRDDLAAYLRTASAKDGRAPKLGVVGGAAVLDVVNTFDAGVANDPHPIAHVPR